MSLLCMRLDVLRKTRSSRCPLRPPRQRLWPGFGHGPKKTPLRLRKQEVDKEGVDGEIREAAAATSSLPECPLIRQRRQLNPHLTREESITNSLPQSPAHEIPRTKKSFYDPVTPHNTAPPKSYDHTFSFFPPAPRSTTDRNSNNKEGFCCSLRHHDPSTMYLQHIQWVLTWKRK